MADLFGSDAFAPAEIARRVEEVGVAKARLPLLQTAMLGVMAGAFIALGALYFPLVASDESLGFASTRVAGGVCFSLGLLLVVVAGAELFTGNNLLAMAWAAGRISAAEVLRNWAVVCAANFVGAAVIAILVCMAVWMAMAGRSVVDKAVAIVFPISAFVAAGFEHSIANMYFFPLALLLKAGGVALPAGGEAITFVAMLENLGPVIAGNIVGGSVLVAMVYWVIYLRGR